MKAFRKPGLLLLNHGWPKPILYPYRTQTTSTMEKVRNVSIIELMLHRFCIAPP
jgi:hypothetical protein